MQLDESFSGENSRARTGGTRSRTPKWRGTVAAIAALGFLLSGCTSKASDGQGAGGQQDGPLKVGAVIYARDLEYWQLVEAGMNAAAAELDVEVSVDVSNRQLQTEAQVVNTITARGDNILVIAPLDTTASVSTLEQARQKSMTVVQIDNRVDDDSFENFVGADQTEMGRVSGESAAKYIEDSLDGDAKIALLTGDTEPNGPPRKKAFLAATDGLGEVVTSTEAVGSPEAGSKAFDTLMQSHPDVDVVWAWNGAALQGAATAAKQSDSTAKIIGIDMSRQVAEMMQGGKSPVESVADQHAYDIGYEAVKMGVAEAKGESYEKVESVPPAVFTASDDSGLQKYLDELAGQ